MESQVGRELRATRIVLKTMAETRTQPRCKCLVNSDYSESCLCLPALQHRNPLFMPNFGSSYSGFSLKGVQSISISSLQVFAGIQTQADQQQVPIASCHPRILLACSFYRYRLPPTTEPHRRRSFSVYIPY